MYPQSSLPRCTPYGAQHHLHRGRAPTVIHDDYVLRLGNQSWRPNNVTGPGAEAVLGRELGRKEKQLYRKWTVPVFDDLRTVPVSFK